MSTVEDIEVNEETTPKLRLLMGGKEPPIITGSNWLIGLDIGSVFLVKKKTAFANPMEGTILKLFQLIWKDGKAVRLVDPEVSEENQPKFFFDSDGFCKMYDKFQDMVRTDGTSNRTDQ